MRTIILIKCFILAIPMIILGIANTLCYGTEQILDPIAQITPTEKDNRLAAKIKAGAAWIRKWGELGNKKLRDLGLSDDE